MLLTLKTPYLSLVALKPTTLPGLTVLTGVNGAGKTHLLKAIQTGNVSVDIAPNHQSDVRFFDWNSLVPNDATAATSTSSDAHRADLLTITSNARAGSQAALTAALVAFGITDQPDPWSFARLSDDALLAARGERADTNNASDGARIAKIREVVRAASSAIVNTSRHPNHRNLGKALELVADLQTIALVTEADLERTSFSWSSTDPFKHSFAEMFFAYFRLWRANELRQLATNKGQLPDLEPLSDAEFQTKHGIPPWDFVNQTIRSGGLDFHISHPTDILAEQFTPKLTKVSSAAEVTFSSLSSGERTLMAFALCVYYSTDDRQLVARPKLLLLDEVDAPLHPSMCRRLLTAISESLVQRGVHVILATHSPSTIAVSPADSIYMMRPGEGLCKTTKQQAIVALTAELPTLAISFHGRRQVVVESALDAERYALLYQHFRAMLASEKSLQFIPSGQKEHVSGCDQVKHIVDSLSEAGNDSVFGLIDWDSKNVATDRVFVLAEGERYAIENCLLDPILLAAVAIREKRSVGESLGLKDTTTLRDLETLDAPQLQRLADAVQRLVLNTRADTQMNTSVNVTYVGGFTLNISDAYLKLNGHDLEEAVKAAFPHLRKFHNSGDLLRHIVDPVIVELPKLVPDVILKAMRKLLEA